MNPSTLSNFRNLGKLGALHARFEPEFDEEDELISDLSGAAQDLPKDVPVQPIPSIYDRPKVNGLAGLAALQRALSGERDEAATAARAASLPLVPEDSGSNFIMKPSSEYMHAGYLPALRAAAKDEVVNDTPKRSLISKVGNFLSRPASIEPNYQNREAEAPQAGAVPPKGSLSKTLTPEQVKFYDESPAARANMTPETKASYEAAKKAQNEKHQKTAELNLVPGAVDEIAKDPLAMAEFGEITGMDYTPQLQAALRPYEKLADQAIGTLSEEEALIRKRFNEGNMTTQDKIYLGLAIAIPAIMAGIYGGGNAALGAIAGGLQGTAQGMVNREERNIEDRKRLADVGKEKLTIEASKADLSKKLRESMPEDQVGDLLAGAKTVTIPETGESGIRVGNDALYYNTANLSKGNIKDEVKEMRTLAKDARERMEAIDSLYDVTKDLDNVYEQLIKSGTTSFVPAVGGAVIPGGENWLSKDVIDPKTGKKMKASVLVGQLVEKGLDKYRTSQIGGSRAITEAMRTHFDALLGNPFKLEQALSIEDARNMTEAFQSIAAKEFIAGMEAEGFLRQPLEKRFLMPIEEKRIALSKSQRAKDREKEAEELIKNMTPEQAAQFRAGNVVEI